MAPIPSVEKSVTEPEPVPVKIEEPIAETPAATKVEVVKEP
jgi:hypothetical protein